MNKTRGTSKIFNENEIRQLEMNPNVENVSEKSITYSSTFKLAALKAYKEGQTPMEVFLEAGFDLDVIGRNKPKHCLSRWRNSYNTHGEAGLLEEQRGKGSTGRKVAGELSTVEKLKRAEARIKSLEMENDFLKKLEALEKQKMQRKR